MTYGSINGRYWNVMSSDAKLAYLLGCSEALIEEAKSEFVKKYKPGELSTGEVRTAMDRFYAEPENALIPVIDALKIVAMKANGEIQQNIDFQISVYRTFSNHAPERKK